MATTYPAALPRRRRAQPGMEDDELDQPLPRPRPVSQKAALPPMTQPLRPSMAGKADDIAADRVRMNGANPAGAQARQAMMDQGAAAANGGMGALPRRRPPAANGGQALLDNATRLVNHETDGQASQMPFSRLETARLMNSADPRTSGAMGDALQIRDNLAASEEMTQTGMDPISYRAAQNVRQAQAQMAAAGVNADSMASVGLGPNARQPLASRQFYGGVDPATRNVVGKVGVEGATDVTQADVMALMNRNRDPQGRNRLTFEQAKQQLISERGAAATPGAQDAAARRAAQQQRLGELEGRRAAIADKYKPQQVDEEVPNVDAKGNQNPLQPTIKRRSIKTPEYSAEDKAELDEIAYEIADARGQTGKSKAMPKRIQSDADYQALPKGAYFINPDDGKVYQK